MAKIRAYHSEDAQSIMKLFHDTVHTVNAEHYTPEQLDAWAPQSMNAEDWQRRLSSRMTLVAEDATEITGFCELESDGHVGCFYVAATHIGRGIGRLLMQEILDLALASGIGELHTEASITAVPFFERQGFRLISRRDIVVRGVEMTNFAMEMPLKDCGG